MDILNTIVKTLSAPLAPVFSALGYRAPQYRPQTQGQIQVRPQGRPPQPVMTVKQQLHATNPQMYNTVWLEAMGEQEAAGRLKIAQQTRYTEAQQRMLDNAGYQKMNVSVSEQNQKQHQKEQIGRNSYDMEQARRIANSNQVFTQHRNEDAPMLQYQMQQEAYRNIPAPAPMLRFM